MALRRHMKNFVKHYSEAEIKVREATSNDPWGPSSSLMLEISDLTYNTASLSEIMNMIWHRMNDHGKNWRHVYKSLTLLDYLLKNGSKKVIQHCQEGFFSIQMLKDFRHLDEAGKDQGFHVREKSKQVIALLADEQLLHNEREIARRTRRRTSYAMLFPQKTSGKAYAPTMAASDPISGFPENVQYFLPKASLPAEQSHPAQTLGKTEIVQETTALNIVSKKSSEDLIIFSEDEPSTTSVQSTFPTRFSREESAMATDTKASASEPWNASTVLSPSERGPLPLKKWDSSRKSKSSIISRVMMKSPPRKLSGKAYKAGATFFNACSSGPEEFIATNTRDSKTEFAPCTSGASVETIYRSSAFQGFAPLGKNITNSMKSTPTSSKQFYGPNTPSLQNLSFTLPNTLQTDGLSSHPSPRPDSASSVGTTSFSTFSMSPPESVVPNNTPQTHCVPSHGTSYLSSSHGLSSLLFKDLKERIVHSFSPFSMSDADENENASILNLLPDNSKEVNNCRSRTCRAFGESFMHNVTSVSNPSMPPAANLPSADLLCVSAEHKGMTILEEIKNAVCGLRGDFCSMAQELHIISSELTNMVAFIQNLNMFLATPQTPKDVPGQMSFSQQPAP
ncbi:ENTH domain-containing protein 1 isoform X1 [Hemicordylus capensis]|uniref:ENTH domain-containing protein 1 isoform X1 n=1 Tax=Hemicordylus capensis TaxID=884348 RepID=UPI00230221C6|nr:ENTH domain-containing protein 1 isoform X1 [Hemicordylus capensis]XP_053113056.1 ENTH domain-containing protein 1 isoform X1 [Hemicordylus capensis]XP_053113057.1 ENTH domain-containing protein 1 isoform X1 [Hemicordylus capensis]XP_053113058.1 ENTH domain-containing protein 1 isoform X1 [Hemicordylus capensis]